MTARRGEPMSDARETLDRWYSRLLGVSVADLGPGQVAVATCDRRTYRALSYGFMYLLWVMHFGDRAAVSVHPAVLAATSRLAWRRKPDDMMNDEFCAQVGVALSSALPGVEAKAAARDVIFFHPGGAAPVATNGELRAITPADKARSVATRGYWRAADHPSASRNEAFGVFLGDRLIAEIITHDRPAAEMAHLVAADGIGVAEEYRGRGYGKALLAHWTRQMQARGRVCIHAADAANTASIAIARSVGYIEYARTRTLSYSPPHEG